MAVAPHNLVEAHACPMSSCQAPAGSPCRTTSDKVALKYHTARFQLVPSLRSELHIATPAVRHPGSTWKALAVAPAGAPAISMEIRIGYARVSTRGQEIQSQIDALEASGVHRLFQEHISTRVKERPEMKAALAAAREYRSLGAKVTLVVHEMKRLGRGALELLKAAEELRDAGIELEFLTGPLAGKHDPSGHGAALFAFFAAMAESERDYIRDKTLEGQETARRNGTAIGGTKVSDEDMLATALRLRDEENLSLREIASRLVIRTGKKRGQHPSAATVMRMLREHDEQAAAATV
ncbi:recombinase family protein [Streptomyces sp. NBC_01373]|uniref:recombinase family protein n=1 Tax=Streptomyces sp. NBC_01373 TaxID=2903843 RepID=UPI00225156F7|nr:recombinase family protein [Streptomyces sp. NBC_01373]MCX4704386.1 recombinase family protein [Streptomyces sp. NBC_01373]MCX4707126.1 recombinase family protein [Streptomyces sp. NBC_01373]